MFTSSRPLQTLRLTCFGATLGLFAGLGGMAVHAQEGPDLADPEAGLVAAAPAVPGTVAVRFEPPQIEVDQICTPATPDDRLQAEWAEWDGVALPDRTSTAIRTEMRRLMEADANRWFDTITAAYALLPTVDESFTADAALLARVNLLVAAGQLKELTNLRLVEQLMQTNISASPRLQNILSEYLMEGIGIEADPAKGMQLLVSAGFGGNADALLKIVELQQKGTEVPGWDVPADLAVTMAFGALVGKLDPMICERVARIAREYSNGTIVTRDIELAEKWFRFAADMGDGASAWKVAEMHLRSEDLVKSNDVLVTYLTLAADAGLPYAQVALGRLYEQGALVPKDDDRAERLYADAAAYGDRAGLLRYVLFLQSRAKTDPAYEEQFREIMAEFAAGDEAPGWVLIALGDFVLADQGRWAGEEEAMTYYLRAEAIGDVDASKRLAPIRFRYATTPEDFYAVVDDVIHSIHDGGEIDPMNGLKNAFACRAPNAPQTEEATYWEGISDATGTQTVNFSPEQLMALAADADPLTLARLQSQAMYGRPNALAQFLTVLERSGAPAQEITFWEDYASRYARVDTSRGQLEMRFAEIGANLIDPALYLRKSIEAGNLEAGLDLAEMLMAADPEGNRAEALALVEPVAEKGNGTAMRMLPDLDPDRFPDLASVAATYADVIDVRGDFHAIAMALPHLAEAAQREDYLRRAITVTDCTFTEVMALADAMGQTGDAPQFDKWTAVAEFLIEDDGWRLVQMGDLLRRYQGDATLVAQLDLYQRGFEAGNITSIHRLLDNVGRSETPNYDPARAADLFVALVQGSEPDDIPRALSRLSLADETIQTAAYARLDITGLYLVAAESGSAAGMREYGKIMMETAETADDLASGTEWVAKAADQGDVSAMLTYADALAFGVGIAPSRPDALEWLQKAADLGNKDAASKLRTMALMPEVTQ